MIKREVVNAILSTLFVLFLFQCGAQLTAPGIVLLGGTQTQLSQLLNFLGGGGLKKVSIFATGISPYITAQIIIHMLSNDVIKHLAELKRMGERGRMRMELYTRLLTFPFALVTTLGTLFLVSGSGMAEFKTFDGGKVSSFSQLSAGQGTLLVLSSIAGTYIALFLADIISKKGVGNGTTLIIMSGIIAALPDSFKSAFNFFDSSQSVIPEFSYFMQYFKLIIYIIFYLIVLLLIVFVNGSVRKIPIQQTGTGMILEKKHLPYLPIKLMPAGVIPVVFAGSIMVFPSAVGEILKHHLPNAHIFIQNYLSMFSFTGLCLYVFLIISFSFFCSHLQINVEEMSRNFEKNAKFIPGVRIGQHTYNHIKGVINRMNCFGAPFLALITVMPNFLNLLMNLPPNMATGGTGLLIVVSGCIQIWDSLKSTQISAMYKIKNTTPQNFQSNPQWQIW